MKITIMTKNGTIHYNLVVNVLLPHYNDLQIWKYLFNSVLL